MATETLTTDQLLSAVLKLPNKVRMEFLKAIYASLEPQNKLKLDEAQMKEIGERSAELRSGAVSGMTLDEFKQRREEPRSGWPPRPPCGICGIQGRARLVRGAKYEGSWELKIEFDRAIEAFLANPSAFPKLEDVRRFTVLRKYPYQLIYEPSPPQVFLIAVVHERRSPTYWQDRI